MAGVIAVALIAGLYLYSSRAKKAAPIESIAVMPFQNKNSDADTEYLSDGLADSLIYRLSQLPNLKVSPTSSVFRYKGKDTDLAQIAKELEVDAVMSGRVSQRGDNLTINVELIDTRTKKLLWVEQYDRKMTGFGWLRVAPRRNKPWTTSCLLYEAKYAKATECLAKDRDTLLTFYDFPAEHWIHIRTTNPIESTFATVRLRTAKTRGCVSRAGILAMVFKLAKSAEQRWRKLKGAARLAQVIDGVRFKDGLQEEAQRIAA
jgi:TolB-like protein